METSFLKMRAKRVVQIQIEFVSSLREGQRNLLGSDLARDHSSFAVQLSERIRVKFIFNEHSHSRYISSATRCAIQFSRVN